MPTGTVPPGVLVTPAQLSRYGVPPAFLAQFAPRPIELQITTAGALGTMTVSWRWRGDAVFSAPLSSPALASWPLTLDEAFADLVFAAGSYLAPADLTTGSYIVDTDGSVRAENGATAGLVNATLWDQRSIACSAVTTEAMTRMRDAVRAPLLTWGDDAATHAAAWVYAKLKRARGATPDGAGAGDQNVFDAEKAAQEFFSSIGEKGRPASMSDTSTTDGPLFPAYPIGDTPRNW